MINIEQIKKEYPLHWLVWNNDYQELQELLETQQHDIEQLDSRGRTPLMLAVRLCHHQSVTALLAGKCNVNAEHNGWSVVQEAVCSGDAAILTTVLEVRDLQRHIQRVTHVPQLLKKLVEAPDFYIEMKWEFTTWVPLMSRLCPSDVYKVYKRGSNVRIDTTLIGFDHTTWQRGNRSYIFKGQADSAAMIEIDHETQEVSIEHLRPLVDDITGIPPSQESVSARLTAPVSNNGIDMDKISFERNKSGIWGWGSDKIEDINGYKCKAYAASNVEFVTSTRTEHLNESQVRMKNNRTPLQTFFGVAEDESSAIAGAGGGGSGNRRNSNIGVVANDNASSSEVPLLAVTTDDNNSSTSSMPSNNKDSPTKSPLSPEEYFSKIDLNGRDVGRLPRTTSKVQRFKANLWLSEQFPIKLQEQVLPILDLMSTMASPHVSKLKDFITMQLPAGFPVKIEIPLFHVLNGCVTFGNVFAMEMAVPNVSHIQEQPLFPSSSDGESGSSSSGHTPTNVDRLTCIIDDCCFEVPPNYVNKGLDHRRQLTFDDEDDLLQFAIQQSLMETGSETDQVDIWEALRSHRPVTPNNFTDEETQLQRVLQESLYGYRNSGISTVLVPQLAITPTIADNSTTPNSVDNNQQLSSNNIPLTLTTAATVANNSIGYAEQQNYAADPALAMALQISQQEQLERQQELQREEEMLEEVLRLSLQEK